MLTAAILASFALPVGMMARAWRHDGASAVILSHFWYLTLIWLVCFPLRAMAIVWQGFVPWAGVDARPGILAGSLALALVIWLGVWAGYVWRRPSEPPAAQGERRPRTILGLAALGCAVALAGFVVTRGEFTDLTGTGYFLKRVGSGHLFMFPELFIYFAIAGLGVMLRPSPGLDRLAWAFFAVAAGLAVFLTMVALSRRLVAMLVLVATIVLVLRHRRAVAVLAVMIVASIVGASALQALRKLWWFHGGGLWERVVEAADAVMKEGGVAWFILHTFEGLEHVAAFLAKAGWRGVAWGIDQGESWLFNAGLAFVPRAVWAGKPLLYGNVEQQRFLHPHLFTDNLPQLTLPPTFVVDFLFGFGIVGGLVLAFGLGRILRWLEVVMRSSTAPLELRIFSIFVFAHTFAVVRSGTGFLQVAAVFAAVLVVVYGVRPLLAGMPGSARTR